MSERFEERVREALAARDDEGADVAGLAAGARSRLRSRRRRTLTVVGAAVAVAAVPTVIAVTGPSRDTTPAPGGPTTAAPDPTPDATPEPGARVESWRDLTAMVPDAWGYGGGSDWCANDGGLEQGPEVVRPDGVVRTIGCTPQNGDGLYFGDGSAISWARESGDVWRYGWESPDQEKVYPEDAWLGLFLAGDHYVMVVTPDEATTREVLGSVSVIRGDDPNGCAPRDGADAAQGDGDRWSVCRYGGDGWLAQSELLTAEESEQFLAAVKAAPTGAEVAPCGEPVDPEPAGRIAAGSGGDLGGVSVVVDSGCAADRGVYLSGTTRELTADVLYWALSPGWSGGVEGPVPLPDPLRR